jgi:hypothetical protein
MSDAQNNGNYLPSQNDTSTDNGNYIPNRQQDYADAILNYVKQNVQKNQTLKTAPAMDTDLENVPGTYFGKSGAPAGPTQPNLPAQASVPGEGGSAGSDDAPYLQTGAQGPSGQNTATEPATNFGSAVAVNSFGVAPGTGPTLQPGVAGAPAPVPSVIQAVRTMRDSSSPVDKPTMTYAEKAAQQPPGYMDLIMSQMKVAYKENYGWMHPPLMTFQEFYKQTLNQTHGFDPTLSGGILYYGEDPSNVDTYNRNIDLMKGLASINFDSAMQYATRGQWATSGPLRQLFAKIGDYGIDVNSPVIADAFGFIPSPGGPEKAPEIQGDVINIANARANYVQLLQLLTKAAPQMKSDAIEAALKTIARPGQTPQQMRAAFQNVLSNQFSIHLKDQQDLGLNSNYWDKQNY